MAGDSNGAVKWRGSVIPDFWFFLLEENMKMKNAKKAKMKNAKKSAKCEICTESRLCISEAMSSCLYYVYHAHYAHYATRRRN